jgi:hypothetical protein
MISADRFGADVTVSLQRRRASWPPPDHGRQTLPADGEDGDKTFRKFWQP